MYFSKVCTLPIIFPSLETLNVRIKAKIITGSPVAKENIEGIRKASEYFNAKGINIPKNNTALNGQKAKANKTPSKKLPK